MALFDPLVVESLWWLEAYHHQSREAKTLPGAQSTGGNKGGPWSVTGASPPWLLPSPWSPCTSGNCSGTSSGIRLTHGPEAPVLAIVHRGHGQFPSRAVGPTTHLFAIGGKKLPISRSTVRHSPLSAGLSKPRGCREMSWPPCGPKGAPDVPGLGGRALGHLCLAVWLQWPEGGCTTSCRCT